MMSSAWNGLEVIRSREKLLYQRTEYSIFPRPLFSQVVIWESAFVRPMKWWIQTRALFKLSSRNIQFWLLKNGTTIQLYNSAALGWFALLTLSAFLGNNVSHSVTTKCSKISKPQDLICTLIAEDIGHNRDLCTIWLKQNASHTVRPLNFFVHLESICSVQFVELLGIFIFENAKCKGSFNVIFSNYAKK